MKNMDIQKKILFCSYIIIALVVLSIIILICKGNIKYSNSSNATQQKESTNNYDVSMMESVDLTTMLNDVFKREDIQVIYMGRSTCSACVSFLPSLQKAQEELGYKTVYLDITTVDDESDEYKQFISKLDKQYTMTGNDGKEVTDEFGAFYGYTPEVVLYKNGKMIDGKIGALDYDEFVDWLMDNGIGK